MILISLIIKLLTPDPKRKQLKEINRKIVRTSDYKELVELTNEYNRIKNENKTN